MPEQIRLLIADDHPIVRNGLSFKLNQDARFTIVAEAGDGETALSLIQEMQPDIAILDIDMPKLDGLQVARRIVELNLKTKTILLTLHKDEDFFRTAMEIGAKGYFLKENATEEIVAGVQAVSDGRTYVSAAMSVYLLRQQAITPDSSEILAAQLTPAERNILKLISLGETSKGIGQKLSLSYRTIENHRTNMCRKLDIVGTNALLRFALEHKATLLNLKR
jgi:DNA-binding NarL/FixJ family response regulator